MRTARKTASPFFSRARLAKACLAIAPALLLAACDSATPVGDPGDTAGEVLPGTISDDMIALDQLRSQGESRSPDDAATDAAGKPASPRAGSAASGEDGSAQSAPEPASEPTTDAAGDVPDEG